MDMTTEARVKALLGEKVAHDSAEETLIGRLITLYSQSFESYLHRTVLAASDVTEYFDVAWGQTVFALKAYPVTDVTSIYNDTSREWTAGDLDTDQYHLDTEHGLLTVDKISLVAGVAALRVIYDGGMAADAAAFIAAFPEIADACDMQVIAHFQRRSHLGAQAVSSGSGNVSHAGPLKILPEVKATLGKYRRLILA